MAERKYQYRKIYLLILTVFFLLSLYACKKDTSSINNENSNDNGEEVITEAAASGEKALDHITKELDTNLTVDADVVNPEKQKYLAYQTEYKAYRQDELAQIFLQDDTSGQTIVKMEDDPNGFQIHTAGGGYLYAGSDHLIYQRNDSGRDTLIEDLITQYGADNPDSSASTKEHDFLTREEAVTIGLETLQKLNIAGEASDSVTVLGMTGAELSKWQDELLTDPDSKWMELKKRDVINDWTAEDDAYYVEYSFQLDGLPVYGIHEPSIQSTSEDWRQPMQMYADMLITRQGLALFEIGGILAQETKISESAEIISLDEAMDKLEEKYSLVILTEKQTITKIWMEYIPIAEPLDNPFDNIYTAKLILTPYWCFQINSYYTDENGNTKMLDDGYAAVERFNAWTGEDLAYGG